MTAPAPGQIPEQVREAYSRAAERPTDEHAFPVGREFAKSLGYPPQLLARLPAISVDAFAGVSNVSLFAQLGTGSVVLDLGCGAGLDSLIAAGRIGPRGKVIGIDFSAPMLERARKAASEAGVTNVVFLHGDAERLPLADHSSDTALVNGIFNLNPAREELFRELARVVRPGGDVYAAELILSGPLRPKGRPARTGLLESPAPGKEMPSCRNSGTSALPVPPSCAPYAMPEPRTRMWWPLKCMPGDDFISGTLGLCPTPAHDGAPLPPAKRRRRPAES